MCVCLLTKEDSTGEWALEIIKKRKFALLNLVSSILVPSCSYGMSANAHFQAPFFVSCGYSCRACPFYELRKHDNIIDGQLTVKVW